MSNILLVFDDFEPISNYKLSLVEKARDLVTPDTIVFGYFPKSSGDRIFQREEKIALLGASIPNSPTPRYVIDGNSFEKESPSLCYRIQEQKAKHKNADLYLLLDSREFEVLRSSQELVYILSMVQLVLYVLPEHKEILERMPLVMQHPILIANTPELNKLANSSIFEMDGDTFPPLVQEYVNKSSECAIKRIKKYLSPTRFKHSLRVAGAIQKINETIELEDAELRYNSYIAALYHDICKEFKKEELIEIAGRELGITSFPSYKVLHGPVGAWFMKTNYLFNDENILEAVAEHTVPSENPKKITKLLYLADHLELEKRDRYPDDIYNQVWEFLDQKDVDKAFEMLLNFCNSKRRSNAS
ncbi:nicotinate-nucleotide adenylyltransferase [Mycoplasma haemofelis str. Langford 1]|uniref:bis(5'-nucleosyl)-tetraphosphatase (symmetrical) n=2 Tax=Mycoplasma haemofelis TaxID=29501 RepID=F6FFN5_MYCHI|nr:bis(5'-nucleosyl)-tetraphosphatase (symmetrical) YqeK [Mycoplasma haemofelis]AEG73453.1 putative nicotinate-nucleotide adenylyltransferase [Mycoplasma haemofelis Ohio2]CBY93132.1 nicotinate-nucleotide adenylyltransferase [Mycoplasma haemofelis str. Langford 1]